ncbi:solute carrier family 35 member G1-like [Argiope bruennichi]|uniref:Solute carrier family 35 member G1 like protein n=1 Tax=Argiope bruennichi TaxID=94029 RepID=A0A8T0EJF3_ARGBR|nr:solute carrier family 35 member G1-like [Argiope bruennichi]XP_055950483.1 solute carrier family 35 member G1-like [Argiope bruennichi]KAF8774052.1 Solute carrier family 35 member G1 like protein [Argiope bruennichi]
MFFKSGVYWPNGTSAETTKKFSIFRGLILAVLSGACFSVVSVIVKQMRNLHPGQLALYRFVAMLVMTMPETVKSGENPLGPSNFRLLLLLRGIFGGLNDFLSFVAFQYLGLGEASVIIFSSPVVVTIFARIFFKEPCNIFQTITVLFTIMGIIFTTKLPSHLTEEPIVYSSEKIYGLLAAMISLFSISGLQLLTRKIRSVHQSIINFNYGLTGIFEMVLLTAIFGNFKWQHCGIQSIYVLLLAIFSYCGLTLMVVALQCEYAGPVSTVRAAADIGLAFMWQIFIFHDTPDVYGIIGAVLVLVSIILISVGKWVNSLEENLFSCEKFKRLSRC